MSITFRPLEANLTHNTELIGKMDPYVLFITGTQKIKSAVCRKGGKHPIWDDFVTVPFAGQATCLVEVRDKDILIDDRIGYCEIDLSEIQAQGSLKKWYPLFHKDKPAGELLMEASFGGPGLGAGQGGLLAGAPVGGMPLAGGLTAGAPLVGGAYPGTHTHPLTGTTGRNAHEIANIMTQGANVVGGTFPIQTAGTGVVPGLTSHAENYAQEALLHGVDPLHSHYATSFNRQAAPGLVGGLAQQVAPGFVGGLPQQVQTFGTGVPGPVFGSTPVLGTTPLQHGTGVGGLATGLVNEARLAGDRLIGNTHGGVPATNMGGLGQHIHHDQATFGHGNP